MERKAIKEAIKEYEYDINHFRRLSGTNVEVVNLKVKANLITADVILTYDIENGHSERFNNCTYHLSTLKAMGYLKTK